MQTEEQRQGRPGNEARERFWVQRKKVVSIGHCLQAALHPGSLQAQESRYELVHKEKFHWKGFLLPT